MPSDSPELQDAQQATEGDGKGRYPALGFDPAPGNTGTVEQLAHNFTTVSTHLGHAHEAMTKAGRSGGFWEGKAAGKFHEQLGPLPDYLDKATRSLHQAGQALDGWQADLTSMQRSAADYEQQAKQAQQTVEQAKSNPDFELQGQHFDTDHALKQAEGKINDAQRRLNEANGELDTIRKQATRLYDQHQDLVKDVERALNNAKDIAPDKPGWLESLIEDIGKAIKAIEDTAKKVWSWVKKHADLIKKIGDVLSVVGDVLSVVAIATSWIPGVDAVTAAAAIGVNGAALATHGLAKAAGADVSWGKLGMDAAGVIPGGKAVAGAKNAATVAARSSKLASKVPVAGTKAVKLGEREFQPITARALKESPSKAVHEAAQYSHAKAVTMANRVPGVNITDPFSAGGIVAGGIARSGMSQAAQEGIQYGTDKVTGN